MANEHTRIAQLEEQLAGRDREDAEKRAAALVAEAAANVVTAKAADDAARSAHLESVRKGAWTTHLLTQAGSGPLDFELLAKGIPASGWPDGLSADNFGAGDIQLTADEATTVSETTLGRALAALQPVTI